MSEKPGDRRKRFSQPVRGGRRKKRRPDNRKRDRGQNGGGHTNYQPIEKKCPMFEKYYQALNIVPPDQWDTFMGLLREDLPVVFRITGTRSHAQEVSKCLEEVYFAELHNIEVDSKSVDVPRPLSWYPDRVAWHVALTRKLLRKSPELSSFHKFLVNESEQGNLTRQEAVSMIPPLLLDVKPGLKVLDMCAAPGSKTAQLIEMMHSEETGTDGLLVANDKDNKRCYMLVHQTKRLNSPYLAVINEDASCLPTMRLGASQGAQRSSSLTFDRILCDVPCSGDGTIRKNYLVWKKWSPSNGNGLHKLQLRILRRGLELLEVGGRLVYSTCSFSPIENEAVVASLLLEAGDALELIDCSSELPGLIRKPGLSTWKVMNKDGELWESMADVPEGVKGNFPRSMFPPDKDDLKKLHLERCMRVLPQDQDTGGFFIVAIRKHASLPWMKVRPPTVETTSYAESTPAAVTEVVPEVPSAAAAEGENRPSESADKEASASAAPAQVPKKRYHGFKEDPFVFMKAEGDNNWKSLKNFFKIEGLEASQLLTRSYGGRKRQIYMVSPLVSRLLPNNEDHVKFINTGVRVFSRTCQKSGSACEFRLNQEGLHAILPYIHGRKLKVTYKELLFLLKNWSPHIGNMLPATQRKAEQLGNGSCIVSFYPGEQEAAAAATATSESACPISSPIHLCGLKSRFTLRLMVSQKDRVHALMLLRQGKVAEIQKEVESQMKQLQDKTKAGNGEEAIEDSMDEDDTVVPEPQPGDEMMNDEQEDEQEEDGEEEEEEEEEEGAQSGGDDDSNIKS